MGIILKFPVEMTLFIHIVIEYIIPKLIVRAFKDTSMFRVEWRINRFDGSVIFGAILGVLFCGLIIFIYWLVDKVIGWNLEDNLLAVPIPRNKVLEIIAAFYLVVVKPYFEEWFWRRYNYFVFYRTEIDFWLMSVLWSSAYVVLAYM